MRSLYDSTNDKTLVKFAKKPMTECYSEECVFKYQDVIYDATVIIPCYNSEKYISECLDSIENQKTKFNVEIIVVNDGSTDSTAEILHRYLNRIDNLRIITQCNKGHAGARNTGIRESKGKYLIFIDSDDYVTNDYLDCLLEKAVERHADITACGYYTFDNNRKKIKNAIIKNETDTTVINGCPWGKAIKRELFNNLVFPEKYWFEDSIIAHFILPRAKVICMVTNCQYAYRSNQDGITRSSVKNIRSIESFYITDLMLRTYHYFYSENVLKTDWFIGTIVEQFYLNEKRIIKLNSECRKAVFEYQSEFLKHCNLQHLELDFVQKIYVFGLIKKKYYISQFSLKIEIFNKLIKKIRKK